HDCRQRLLGTLGHAVVTADHRAGDRRLRAQALLEENAWSDGARSQNGSGAGVLFAADAAEELVQIVRDAVGHDTLLSTLVRVARTSRADSWRNRSVEARPGAARPVRAGTPFPAGCRRETACLRGRVRQPATRRSLPDCPH